MLRKFRGKNLALEKKNKQDSNDALATPTQPYCHACGQKTPSRSTFGTISYSSTNSSHGDRSSWNSSSSSSSASDSGYDSFASSTNSSSSSFQQRSRSGSQAGDSVVSIPSIPSIPSYPAPAPPIRRGTYSSSVYSADESGGGDTVEPFPVIVEEHYQEQERCDYDYEFDLPSRTLSTYSDKFKPPRSRYARLNDLPVESPRSSLFPDDVYHLDAGIEREEGKEGGSRRRRWHKGSISTRLRRLSIANLRKP